MRYCSLASGSNGNCHYIEQDRARVLVDLGLTARTVENRLRSLEVDPGGIRAILVTHEHSDHVQGVGVWARRYKIPIMASEGTWSAMAKSVGNIPGELQVVLKPGKGYRLDDLRIEAFHTYHDARDPFGYSFECGDRKLTIMTDTGTVSSEMEAHLKRSQFAVVESNHDIDMLMNGSYPWPLKKRVRSNLGHLSNQDCGLLLRRVMEVNPEATVLLGHLSDENNEPQLALETVQHLVEPVLPVEKQHIYLTVRGDMTKMFEI